VRQPARWEGQSGGSYEIRPVRLYLAGHAMTEGEGVDADAAWIDKALIAARLQAVAPCSLFSRPGHRRGGVQDACLRR